ncbi:MAG: BatA domain-containing protein [Planctomycetaceae bacterium]
MEFLNPIYLAGLISAGIPLLIHLRRSRRTKTMSFSTTRFFTPQFLQSYRMSRLKEYWLLAARMLLFALLAMALAQPLLLPSSGRHWFGGSRAVVIVLDDSASMGYVENGESLFDRARKSARDILDQLGSGDQASFVLAGRRAEGPQVLFQELTSDLVNVRQALEQSYVTDLADDVPQAMRRAEQIAEASTAASREIYIFSDMQHVGREDSAVAGDAQANDVLHFFVSVRPKDPHNHGITAVQYLASRPMVGVPFEIRPHLHFDQTLLNVAPAAEQKPPAGTPAEQGTAPSSVARLELFVDDKKVAEQPVLSPGQTRWTVPRLRHTFESGGWHTGYVQLTGDSFAADNRRHFAFEVVDQVSVLAVNGAPSSIPRSDELYFLKTALAASAAAGSSLTIHTILPEAILQTQLDNYDTVILANVGTLPADAVLQLEQWVDRGGTILQFLGDRTVPAFFAEYWSNPTRLHGGLFGGKITTVQGDPASENPLARIGEVDSTHPALASFADDESHLMAGVHFSAWWHLDPGDSRILMTNDLGEPLLCEKSFGKGRTLLFTSACDRDWSNFPVRPAYLPWVYRLLGSLAQKNAVQSFQLAGDDLPLPTSTTAGLTNWVIEGPDETVGYPVSTGDVETPLVFRETWRAGSYRLHPANQTEESIFVAVNLDPYESNLTYLKEQHAEQRELSAETNAAVESTPAELEAYLLSLFPSRPFITYVDDPSLVLSAAETAKRGIEFWDFLLYVSLLLALIEPWIANRISLDRYLKSSPTVTRWLSEHAPQSSEASGASTPASLANPGART